MFLNLKRRIMHRRSSAGKSNCCIDTSYNTTSTCATSRSIVAKCNLNDSNKTSEYSTKYQSINDCEHSQEQQQDKRTIKKIFRRDGHRRRRRNNHTKDHQCGVANEYISYSFQPAQPSTMMLNDVNVFNSSSDIIGCTDRNKNPTTNNRNRTNASSTMRRIEAANKSHETFDYVMNLESQYVSKQTELQALARKMDQEGNLGRAIKCWKQSLDLAESNRDFCNLSSVTEILCMLVNLHHHESKRLEELEKQGEDKLNPSMSSGYPSITANDSRCGITTLSNEDTASVAHHKCEAQRCLHRVKVVLVKPEWLQSDLSMLEFLCEVEAWELALMVALQLSEKSTSSQSVSKEGKDTEKTGLLEEFSDPVIDPQKIAGLHYRIASMKIESYKPGEALQHLQAAIGCLQKVSVNERDMTMYLLVLDLLAVEYQNQGQWMLALKTYQEKQNYAPPEKRAHISCQIAELYISDHQLGMALQELESAYDQHDNKSGVSGNDCCDEKNDSMHAIRLQLLQTKADVYLRLGRIDESIEVYQQALQEAKNPAEKAKLFYIMGRLCIRLGRVQDAISCFMDELEITKNELGFHQSVSVIYHELAKLYDEGLGSHDIGIQMYKKALQIELVVMDELQTAISFCNKCHSIHSIKMCNVHANFHAQLNGQINETKKCLGRIQFKLGDFDGALKTSLDSYSCG